MPSAISESSGKDYGTQGLKQNQKFSIQSGWILGWSSWKNWRKKSLVEEPEKEKRSDDGANTGYCLGDDILEGKGGRKGKAQIKIFGTNNWGYGMRDI